MAACCSEVFIWRRAAGLRRIWEEGQEGQDSAQWIRLKRPVGGGGRTDWSCWKNAEGLALLALILTGHLFGWNLG